MLAIDRRRFLALTTAMATAHCAPPAPPVIAVPAEEVKVGPASASSAPASAPNDDSKPPQPQSKETASDGDGTLAMGDSDDAERGALSKVKGQRCPATDNMKGAPSACALKSPGPTCESFMDTKSQCDATRSWLKPRIAEKAVQCHLAKSGTPAICKFNLVTDCVTEALSSACIDPAAVTTCKQVMNKCGTNKHGKLTDDACAAAVSAVSDAQRTKFVSCITEFCRFETCFYHLVPTAEAGGKKRLFNPGY